MRQGLSKAASENYLNGGSRQRGGISRGLHGGDILCGESAPEGIN